MLKLKVAQYYFLKRWKIHKLDPYFGLLLLEEQEKLSY